MQPRIDMTSGNRADEGDAGIERVRLKSGLEKKLIDLIDLRVSHINGCAYCIDIHWKDLRAEGETEQRLYASTRGTSHPTTPTVNAPRWRGPRPLLALPALIFPPKCLKQHASISATQSWLI